MGKNLVAWRGSCSLLMTLQKIPPAPPYLVKNERSLISQTQKCAKKSHLGLFKSPLFVCSLRFTEHQWMSQSVLQSSNTSLHVRWNEDVWIVFIHIQQIFISFVLRFHAEWSLFFFASLGQMLGDFPFLPLVLIIKLFVAKMEIANSGLLFKQSLITAELLLEC